jgi:hypothetical protein
MDYRRITDGIQDGLDKELDSDIYQEARVDGIVSSSEPNILISLHSNRSELEYKP